MPGRPTRRQGMQDTTLQVSGMTCKSCVARVNRALSALDGVREIEVELGRGTVRIRHAPELTATQLAARVSEAGYPSRVA
ncbi:MAG TPA: heavy metal-associated domain-containing protein [Enhygromyxa sp.]|nr:heavy metal-associated domain-containing protein [Enhygromyxa sp.]